jgi:hypothetical protein
MLRSSSTWTTEPRSPINHVTHPWFRSMREQLRCRFAEARNMPALSELRQHGERAWSYRDKDRLCLVEGIVKSEKASNATILYASSIAPRKDVVVLDCAEGEGVASVSRKKPPWFGADATAMRHDFPNHNVLPRAMVGQRLPSWGNTTIIVPTERICFVFTLFHAAIHLESPI